MCAVYMLPPASNAFQEYAFYVARLRVAIEGLSPVVSKTGMVHVDAPRRRSNEPTLRGIKIPHVTLVGVVEITI